MLMMSALSVKIWITFIARWRWRTIHHDHRTDARRPNMRCFLLLNRKDILAFKNAVNNVKNDTNLIVQSSISSSSAADAPPR
jgi:hypothetical protein